MLIPRELSRSECVDLLTAQSVGRVALCTPMGPRIFPVNYIVDGSSVIFRTSPYSTLGTYGWGLETAFEVDQLDHEQLAGWSVIALGRGQVIEAPDEIAALIARPQPWAGGSRNMYVRLAWREISGRAVGQTNLSASQATRRPRTSLRKNEKPLP